MTILRFSRPPTVLRQARFDNLVLIPASQLPFKDAWQHLANKFPEGTTLIVLPERESPQRATLMKVAHGLMRSHQAVRTAVVSRGSQGACWPLRSPRHTLDRYQSRFQDYPRVHRAT